MSWKIATIKYIRKYTQIPAPDVLGYDADEDGGVGGEWMVMEYVRLSHYGSDSSVVRAGRMSPSGARHPADHGVGRHVR